MTTETTPTNAAPHPVPRWVGLAIPLAIILAIAGGAGWWYWSASGQPDPNELVEVMAPRGFGGGGRGGVDGVRSRPNGTHVARAGDVVLNATRPKDAKDWVLRVTYSRPDVAPADQAAALNALYRLPRDQAFQKSLKVTPEQIKQLKSIPIGTAMVVSDADGERIKTLWQAYITASGDKRAAENALIRALREVGRSSLAATRSSIAERARQVEQILTPEQIGAFK